MSFEYCILSEESDVGDLVRPLLQTIVSPPSCKETMEPLVKTIQKMSSCTTVVVEKLKSAETQLEYIKEDASAEKEKLEGCKRHFYEMYIACCTFVEKVHKYLQCSIDNDDRRAKNIKAAITKGQFGTLKAYIQQLEQFFDQCDPALKDYTTTCKKTRPLCESGAKICCEKMKAAKAERTRAQWIGGSVATVFAVTGVVGVAGASVVAGLFSFGIGTPVVLGISAAASGGAIVGGGTAAATAGVKTYNIAKSYEGVMKDFDECQKQFDLMSNCAATIDVEVFGVSRILKSVLKDIDNVKLQDESIMFCLSVFDSLYDHIKEAHEDVGVCKTTMKNNSSEYF